MLQIKGKIANAALERSRAQSRKYRQAASKSISKKKYEIAFSVFFRQLRSAGSTALRSCTCSWHNLPPCGGLIYRLFVGKETILGVVTHTWERNKERVDIYSSAEHSTTRVCWSHQAVRRGETHASSAGRGRHSMATTKTNAISST